MRENSKNYWSYFRGWLQVDYIAFLSTISGIGGVFIGLYYTGIGVVSSTNSKVSSNIKDLFFQERFGTVYMRFLSFLTFLGLILISLDLMGVSRSFVAVPVMVLFSGIGVYAFVGIGRRAFYLFDPTQLSEPIFEKLNQSLKMVQVGAFNWSDASFQKHAHIQAAGALDSLCSLAEFTSSERHLCGKPFVDLSGKLIAFLVFYEKFKSRIPTKSLWYQQIYKHPDWYCTGDTMVSIAHESGTLLQPELVMNHEWVEDKVFPIIERCITKNLEIENYSEVSELIERVGYYIESLAELGRLNEAFKLIRRLTIIVFDNILTRDAYDINDEEEQGNLILAEISTVLSTKAVLGFSKSIDMLYINSSFSRVKWGHDYSFYKSKLPFFVLHMVENLNEKLIIEKRVEGEIVSPSWYIDELFRLEVSSNFAENIDSLISQYTDLSKYLVGLDRLKNHPWIKAAVLSQEWEYWHKVSYHFADWEACWAHLTGSNKIKGIKWAEIDFSDQWEKVKQRNNRLMLEMSVQGLLLTTVKASDKFPDYSGSFLHATGEAAIDALLNNELVFFKGLFAAYFYGCISKFESIKPTGDVAQHILENRLKVAFSSMMDLMDVTGYAKLLSEYHEIPDYWDEVVSVWNKYVNACVGQNGKPLEIIIAGIGLTVGGFEIPHRSIHRTKWSQKIETLFRKIPRIAPFARHIYSDEYVVQHNSPLVRVFAAGEYRSRHDGVDVFIEYYLKLNVDIGTADYRLKGRRLAEDIVREIEHFNRFNIFLKNEA